MQTNDEATFARSQLDRSHGDDELRAFYAELLRVRHELPDKLEIHVDDHARRLGVRRGRAELHVDLERMTADLRA